ncbi:MAG: hypothetical protein LLF76_02755 [Planctomycetaceae bacterium]|nr:hypothetical protein [Planctomycetaceae bacterium]
MIDRLRGMLLRHQRDVQDGKATLEQLEKQSQEAQQAYMKTLRCVQMAEVGIMVLNKMIEEEREREEPESVSAQVD